MKRWVDTCKRLFPVAFAMMVIFIAASQPAFSQTLTVTTTTDNLGQTHGQLTYVNGNVITPAVLKGFTFTGRDQNSCGTQDCPVNVTACNTGYKTKNWASWDTATNAENTINTEVQAARDDFGANTIRLQIAEYMILPWIQDDSSNNYQYTRDTPNPVFDPTYLEIVDNAIQVIRSMGMNVELSMQSEDENTLCSLNGTTTPYTLPPGSSANYIYGSVDQAGYFYGVVDQQLADAWAILMNVDPDTVSGDPGNVSLALAEKAIGGGNTASTPNPGWTANGWSNDRGVILEVMNEPGGDAGCAMGTQWAEWAAPEQLLVNTLRMMGAANIIFVPALSADHMLDSTDLGGLGSLVTPANWINDYTPGTQFPLADYYSLNDTGATTTTPTPTTAPQLAFAMHPYPKDKGNANQSQDCINGDFDQYDWERWWGRIAKFVPVVVTEWDTGGEDLNNCLGGATINSDDSVAQSETIGSINAFPYNSYQSAYGYSGIYDIPSDYQAGYGDLTPFSPTIAYNFMNWLSTAGYDNSTISITGAWDFENAGMYVQPGFTLTDPTTYIPTTFGTDPDYGSGFACTGDASAEGPGSILSEYFKYGFITDHIFNYVYVANGGSNTVSAYSVGSGAFGTVSGSPYSLGFTPTAMALRPDSRFLYVGGNGYLYVYTVYNNASENDGSAAGSLSLPGISAVFGGAPSVKAMDASPDGNWVLVLDATHKMLIPYQINLTTGALTAGMPASFTASTAVSVKVVDDHNYMPNNDLIFVSLGTNGELVYTFNTITGVINANPASYAAPQSMSYNSVFTDVNSKYLYIVSSTTGASGAVYGFSIGTGGALTSLPGSPYTTAAGAAAGTLNKAGTYAYIASPTASDISGFSIVTTNDGLALSGTYATGTSPTAITPDSSGNYMLAISNSSSNLSMYSFDATVPGQLDPVASMPTGTSPVAMAVTQIAAGSQATVQAVLMPTAVTFPNQTVATTSNAQIVTLSNIGDAVLDIGGISIIGANPADFAETTTCGTTLVAGASCNISISFTPMSAATFSASLGVADNATSSPQMSTLTGTGMEAQTITFPEPSSPVVFGSTGSAKLKATASSGLAVTYTVTSGPATIGGDNGNYLNYTGPGTVVVTASQAGNANYSAAAPVSNTIVVTAVAAEPVEPSTLAEGSNGTLIVTLTFKSSFTLGLLSVTSEGASGTPFAVTSGGTCATGTAYSSGSSCMVQLTYTPTGPGVITGTVQGYDNSADKLLEAAANIVAVRYR